MSIVGTHAIYSKEMFRTVAESDIFIGTNKDQCAPMCDKRIFTISNMKCKILVGFLLVYTFCCTHVHATESHEAHQHHNLTAEHLDENSDHTHHSFLHKIFEKYGKNGVMTFEGFEHLLESLGLGHVVISDHDIHDHFDPHSGFKDLHPDHNHTAYGNDSSSSQIHGDSHDHHEEHDNHNHHHHDDHDHNHSDNNHADGDPSNDDTHGDPSGGDTHDDSFTDDHHEHTNDNNQNKNDLTGYKTYHSNQNDHSIATNNEGDHGDSDHSHDDHSHDDHDKHTEENSDNNNLHGYQNDHSIHDAHPLATNEEAGKPAPLEDDKAAQDSGVIHGSIPREHDRHKRFAELTENKVGIFKHINIL